MTLTYVLILLLGTLVVLSIHREEAAVCFLGKVIIAAIWGVTPWTKTYERNFIFSIACIRPAKKLFLFPERKYFFLFFNIWVAIGFFNISVIFGSNRGLWFKKLKIFLYSCSNYFILAGWKNLNKTTLIVLVSWIILGWYQMKTYLLLIYSVYK